MPQTVSRLRRLPLFSRRRWSRRIAYWAGGALVGIAAIGFAASADRIAHLRTSLATQYPWAMLAIAPAGFALSCWLTRRWFAGAQGSGIPQVIAALHMSNPAAVDRVLSVRVAAGKILLTLLGLLCGGSIGREGPTVQLGATMMHGIGRLLGARGILARRALILAGGAAGISAAFNTPLAGIVFAIEELSHSFENRTSGTMLTAVILSGVTSIALVGNYTYFGRIDAHLPAGMAWVAAPVCGVAGGIAGGSFASLLVAAANGIPTRLGRLARRHPVQFAGICGLALAGIGLVSHGETYGTGYDQARAILAGHSTLPADFFALKFLASLISSCSGVPGGIFAPSLAVGAGLGGWIAPFLPGVAPGTVVLLGMAAYFCGVVQAPLTATVIVMEMTDNQQVVVALLATSFLAFGASRLICRRPLYGALARQFLGTGAIPGAGDAPGGDVPAARMAAQAQPASSVRPLSAPEPRPDGKALP